MEYLLEIVSASLSISLLAYGLSLIQRSYGIVVLETLPFAIGCSLFFLDSLRPRSPSTLYAPALILPTLASLISIFVLQKWYSRWRLRVAGEPTALLLSFAIMNVWILYMSKASNGLSVPLGLEDFGIIRTKLRLEAIDISLSLLVIIATVLYLGRRGLMAAIKLAKDDHRLLTTFGHDANRVKRRVLYVSIGLCTIGTLLFVSLQDTFAVSNCFAVLIPAFAVAIAQNRIKAIHIAALSLLLGAGVQILTLHTSELLRDVHTSLLFCVFVVGGVCIRKVNSTGLAPLWRRSYSSMVQELTNGSIR